MNLVPVYPIVVYDYSQRSFHSLTAEEQVAAAQQKRDGLQAKIRSIQERMEKMSAAVLLHNKPIMDMLQEVENEIAELERERQRLIHAQNRADVQEDDPEWASKEEDLEAMFEEFYTGFEQAEQQRSRNYNEELAKSAEQRQKKSKEVAKLFRKIAMKTHPDRTKDPEMHKLFLAAKQYYACDDLDGLQEIWEAVSGKRMSRLLAKLFKRLQELLAEIKFLEKTLKAMRESDEFEILTLYEARGDALLSATYKQNQMKLQMLSQHRDNLLLGLGRKPKSVETPFTQFFF